MKITRTRDDVSAGAESVMLVSEAAVNNLNHDAWGRPKVVNDYSLFSALWTLSVPNRVWLQYLDTGAGFVEQSQIDNDLVKSVNGHLQITGTSGIDVALVSKRHPRYQPNKGLLYSTAVIIPNPENVGIRNFGLITSENGLFFQVEGDGTNWTLSIVKRTTENGVTSDIVTDITADLPSGFDISKGHVYDLQMQWRGVGNFYIYADLEKTHTLEMLGTLDELSISNPAMHVGWQCLSAGAFDIKLIAGCVDVTSEGGYESHKEYTSVDTGTDMLSTDNSGRAILAVKLPTHITYNGKQVRYTRDLILTAFSTFCKDEAFRSIYVGRLINTPNLDGLSWTVADDSFYEYITGTDGTLNTAFHTDKGNMSNIYSTRNEKDFAVIHSNLGSDKTEFYLTGGDVLVVEIKSDSTSTGGVTLEFAEEL